MLAPLPLPAFRDTIRRCRLIAVYTKPTIESAVPLAKALWQGGVRGMEITFRTQEAGEVIRRIRDAVPGICIGAGTLLDRRQVREALQAGSHYGVAPGCSRAVIEAAADLGLPFGPGVATPTDIEAALAADCRLLKFFPAKALGGLAWLRTVSEPYAHLGVDYLPLGGIDLGSAMEYLAFDRVAAVGGSWLLPAEALATGDWTVVERLATEATARIRELAE